jgi:dephospho-CoA kinase
LRIYGITGGVASGKSTAAGFFRSLGVPVVDADEVARDLRNPGGAASDLVLKRFGTLDAAALRAKIANDAAAKRDLEAILHPLIQSESERRFAAIAAAAGAKTPYCLYEAALLVEAGRAPHFAGVILVESSRENRLRRLIERDGMDPEDARRFLDATLAANPIEGKRAGSTHFIVNDGTLDELRDAVARLHSQLVS